jgi:hypothetical protein
MHSGIACLSLPRLCNRKTSRTKDEAQGHQPQKFGTEKAQQRHDGGRTSFSQRSGRRHFTGQHLRQKLSLMVNESTIAGIVPLRHICRGMMSIW